MTPPRLCMTAPPACTASSSAPKPAAPSAPVITTTGVASLASANFAQVTGSASGASIGDTASAASTLIAVSNAITDKDSFRSQLGYMMNRLESASTRLSIRRSRTCSAESRVSDVDVATEMAAFTRNQVLAQSGISMLAQANTMPQMALTLLRG